MESERQEVEAAIGAMKGGRILTAIDIYKGLVLRTPTQEETMGRAMLEEIFFTAGIDPLTYAEEDEQEEESSCFNNQSARDPLLEMEEQHKREMERLRTENLKKELSETMEKTKLEKELEAQMKCKWGDQDERTPFDIPKATRVTTKEGEKLPSAAGSSTTEGPPPLENVEDPARVIIGDFHQLMEMIGSIGITLTPDEERPLMAKSTTIGGLCVRDVIMFLEGSRTRSTLSEAKMSNLTDENAKLTQTLITQTRVLDKYLTEIKEQERSHARQLEERVTKKERKLANRERILDELEKNLRKKMEEMSKVRPTLSTKPSLPTPVGLSPPSSYLSTPRTHKAPSQEAILRAIQQVTSRPTDSPCTGFLTLCMEVNKSPEDYAKFYGVTIGQINELMEDMPETGAEMKRKYGSIKAGTMELHTRIRSKYPIGSE
ncbi:TPA_asm: protein 2 [Amentotaxus virus 1]|uniref:Protein 2 n=1 Tax=Amentotaxus virus 1 TaxID=2977950 RepID=A0A9N7AAS6_9RHAB|nr:TPA_asm: protein 2 [Amentotaxus virus 1]